MQEGRVISEILEGIKREILEAARRTAEAENISLCKALQRLQDRMYRAAGEALRRRRYPVAERYMETVDFIREVEKQQGCIT